MARKLMLKKKDGFDEYLRHSYVDKEMTMSEIAEEVGCCSATILNHLKRIGVDTRTNYTGRDKWELSEEAKANISKAHKDKEVSEETRKKMSKAAKGRESPNWNGGKRHRSDGYIQIFNPEHPNSCKEGYVMEHRLVMEEKIGRLLKKKEVVHHINGVRDDNRPENLKLFKSVGEHTKFHAQNNKGDDNDA